MCSVSILAARARDLCRSLVNEMLIVGRTIFPLDPIRRGFRASILYAKNALKMNKKNSETDGIGIVAITMQLGNWLQSNFVIVCKSGKLEIIQFDCTKSLSGLRFHNYINKIDKAALNNLLNHFERLKNVTIVRFYKKLKITKNIFSSLIVVVVVVVIIVVVVIVVIVVVVVIIEAGRAEISVPINQKVNSFKNCKSLLWVAFFQ